MDTPRTPRTPRDTHTAQLAGGDTAELTPGHDYIIVYRFSGWGYDREARLGFIGTSDTTHGELWNARPHFGTQEIPASVIKTVALADDRTGRREDPARYIGRRAPVTR